MSRQSNPVWEILLQAGLVEGAAPGSGETESPWYVKVLLAISGWLAAGFLLGFVGMAFRELLRSETASLCLGGLMIGAAFVVLRMPKNEFLEHLALAVSLAGQALVVAGLFKFTDHQESVAWLLVVLLQAGLATVMPNFVHRVFSAFFAAFCLNMFAGLQGWPNLVDGVIMFLAAWCWLNEFRYPRQMPQIRAIGYGLVLGLMMLKGMALLGSQATGAFFRHRPTELWFAPWLGEVLTGAVVLYVVWQLLQRHDQGMSSRLAVPVLLAALLVSALSLWIKGLGAGLVIVLLGFHGANRVLLGLGILSLLFYISCYYYLLDATLLVKSATLLGAGVVLLGLRWLLAAMMPKEREADHV